MSLHPNPGGRAQSRSMSMQQNTRLLLPAMSGRPLLHYFNGRGRAESIRLMLAASGLQVRRSPPPPLIIRILTSILQ